MNNPITKLLKGASKRQLQLLAAHESWKALEVTMLLAKLLEDEKKNLAEMASVIATSSDTPKDKLLVLCSQYRLVSKIERLIHDSRHFAERAAQE